MAIFLTPGKIKTQLALSSMLTGRPPAIISLRTLAELARRSDSFLSANSGVASTEQATQIANIFSIDCSFDTSHRAPGLNRREDAVSRLKICFFTESRAPVQKCVFSVTLRPQIKRKANPQKRSVIGTVDARSAA
jgi:hypothetical protein